MAFEAVANYGMNKLVGPVSYGGRESSQGLQKPFSEQPAQMLDQEVRKMVV